MSPIGTDRAAAVERPVDESEPLVAVTAQRAGQQRGRGRGRALPYMPRVLPSRTVYRPEGSGAGATPVCPARRARRNRIRRRVRGDRGDGVTDLFQRETGEHRLRSQPRAAHEEGNGVGTGLGCLSGIWPPPPQGLCRVVDGTSAGSRPFMVPRRVIRVGAGVEPSRRARRQSDFKRGGA